MSDNMDPSDIYNPHSITPPPTEPTSPHTFSDPHVAKDTALDETTNVEASNPENEPGPLSSESPPDQTTSSESPPEPLKVEDLPGATTAPEHPTSKDGGQGSAPSAVGPNDLARANGESSDVNGEIEIDRAMVAQPQGLVPYSSPLEPNAFLRLMQALMAGQQPQTNGATNIYNFFTNHGNFSLPHTTGPNQPAGDPPKTAANPPQPRADTPADESTSPKASSTSTSSNDPETKPAAGSDKGEKVQSFIRGATLPFRWMCRILLHNYVIMLIAVLFSIFVLLPIVLTLGVYLLSHAPSYVSNHILGKGYEYGNPFGVSYPTWMPSWGSSQNDAVPSMHVAEEAQEPSPLTFQRPIPQAETDILPDVILRYEERLAGIDHKHEEAVLGSLVNSKRRAQDQKKFNQHFIDDMEAWSIIQYRHLQALVGSVDLILKQLLSEIAGGRAAEGGAKWRWWESRTTARQRTLQDNLDSFQSIIDKINEGLSTGHDEIVGMMLQDGHVSGLNKQALDSCLAREILRHSEDAELRDLASGFKILCSSERRTRERWGHVHDAITKFQNSQQRIRQMFNNRSKDYTALEDAYRDIKALAMALMGALEEFARLSEEEEG
ncbi:hypothetical protein CEP54_010370 [Fusarium duplospermum]|uniref:Uncharacterized protein n=1 Tax=Fusarium duplospermum TaxID=1325734 RepID=A0A428PKB0_9HYPO|nr:hypothetical protein CEP54_010370 [Fusarium duplospermum]